MNDDEGKYHLEARAGGKPMPTGWETACGKTSAGLSMDPDDVDCGACLRTDAFRFARLQKDIGPPVAWRWRYVRNDGPDKWVVRQSPIEPQPARDGFCAIEVEPLYALER